MNKLNIFHFNILSPNFMDQGKYFDLKDEHKTNF
jgi:hypothetical protein